MRSPTLTTYNDEEMRKGRDICVHRCRMEEVAAFVATHGGAKLAPCFVYYWDILVDEGGGGVQWCGRDFRKPNWLAKFDQDEFY